MMTPAFKLKVFKTPEELGKSAAEMITLEYERKGRLVLGVPWGTTPVPILDAFAEIVKAKEIDLSSFHMVMMDEYVQQKGLGYSFVDANLSFSGHFHMEKDLFRKLPAKQAAQLRANTHFPDPNSPESFDSEIESFGGVDIFIVATGAHDGHVAQNGPGTPLQLKTRLLTLSKTVIEYNFEKMREEFGNNIGNVPKFGISIGLSTILKSRKLLFVAFGSSKKRITQRLLSSGRFDPDWPVTFLWEAPGKTEFYIDKEVAGEK